MLKWSRNEFAGYEAREGDAALCVSPENTLTRGFKTRAASKTRWRASVSVWNGKDTWSRMGRDDFPNTYATAKEAQQVCESIYREALS